MTGLLSSPSHIVLTGATSGIGAAMSAQLLAQGHSVTAVSRRAGAIPPQPRLRAVDCNLSDPDDVRRAMADISASRPLPVIVINNAALQYATPLTEPDLQTGKMIEEAMVNLVAPALIAHATIPPMLANGQPAAIVNIGSGLAFFPKTATALYCATKAGLHSFSQSLRYQLEGTNIRVVEAILPLVETPMTEGRGTGKISAEAAAKAILAGVKRGQDEIYIGKAKLLIALGRILPALPRAMLRRS